LKAPSRSARIAYFAAALLLALAGGTSLAAASEQAAQPRLLRACAKAKTGELRLVRGKRSCRRGERYVTWNVGGAQGLPGAAGPAGSSGPTGSTGSQGPAGPRGQAGAQGSTGAQGPEGPQGAAGPQGLTGPEGPQGPQGVQGAKGLNWQGAWSTLSQYFTDDAVFNQGSAYVALNASFGDEPPSSNWSLLAQQGATGATGAQGPAGPAGPQGPQGAQGPDGAQGSTGAQGPEGAQGATGPEGPTGPEGAQGAQGAQGEKGLNWQGAWSPLSQYFTDDAVFNQGSAYLALNASFGDEPPSSNWSLLAQQGATGATGAQGPAGPAGPQGPQGAQGPDGAQGPAGPEGPAGAQGSTGAQGPEGPQGPAGAQGSTGPRGPTIFTGRANLYTGNTMFAPVTGIAQVTGTESDVETLSPNASLTAQDLSVRTSAAPGVGASVTVTLRDDTADTAVTCTVSGTNTTCTSPSTATIAAGSKMSVKLTSTGVIAGLSILFGWQAA
jgi:hypothetical protein